MKYDWIRLKRKFMTGKYTTLKVFAQKENIEYKRLREKASGWLREKRAKDEQKTVRIIEQIAEKEIAKEVDRNTKHLAAWDSFLVLIGGYSEKELSALASEPTAGLAAVERLAKILEKVQRGQRLALGLDKPDTPNQDNKTERVEIIFKEAEHTDE